MFYNVFGEVLSHYDNRVKRKKKPMMRVPESHDIYVLPRACGRRIGIKAISEGTKDKISFIYIEEEDVILGGYEDIIVESATEILSILIEKPKAVFLYVTCIDDLLGTDHNVFLEKLRDRFSEIDFAIGHMNPISYESSMPPPASKLYSYFGLLKKSKIKEKRVNIIGAINDPIITPDLERLLSEKGYELTDLFGCKTYEQFQKMSNAILNIVISPMAIPAAKHMQEKLGIPYIEAYVNYDLNQITEDYKKIMEKLGEKIDTSKYLVEGRTLLEQLKKKLGDTTMAISSSAVLRPIHLGNFFIENGFNVRFIFEGMVLDCDYPLYEKYTKGDFNIIYDSKGLQEDIIGFENSIAIGERASWRLGTDDYIDFNNSEVNYGYSGFKKLIGMIDQFVSDRMEAENG